MQAYIPNSMLSVTLKYMENPHLSEFLAVCAELNAEIAFTAAEIACRIEAAGVTDTNLRLKN